MSVDVLAIVSQAMTELNITVGCKPLHSCSMQTPYQKHETMAMLSDINFYQFLSIQYVCNELFFFALFRLSICNLSDQCCEILASTLQSSDSSLRELDLSNNDLQGSRVELLCAGLKSPNCQLNILRFVFHIDSHFNIYSFMCFCIKDCSTCTLIHECFMVKRY